MIVVQNDSYTISVGYQLISWENADPYYPGYADLTEAVCNDYVSFDLADRIDGEIVSVEWLPSIFISD
jgi:hypothetical protein